MKAVIERANVAVWPIKETWTDELKALGARLPRDETYSIALVGYGLVLYGQITDVGLASLSTEELHERAEHAYSYKMTVKKWLHPTRGNNVSKKQAQYFKTHVFGLLTKEIKTIRAEIAIRKDLRLQMAKMQIEAKNARS